MATAPSRQEIEHLRRLMMQASGHASQLDKRLNDEQKGDSLSIELRHWHDAADALQGAVERARAELLRDGTPRNQLDRVHELLQELKDRSKRFDFDDDLEGCVQHWKVLGIEFAQLSGKHRDKLVGLLDSKKSRVDQTTAVLSSARRASGMLPEKYAKVRGLQDQRDNARAKYERLRQKYLEAERDHQNAERQKAQAEQVKEHQEKKAALPSFAAVSGAVRKGPVLVRLPDPQAADKIAQHKLPQMRAKPSGRNAPSPGLSPLPPALNRPPLLLRPSVRPLSLTRAQQPQQHGALRKASGPARISLERIERVAGYPTGVDGIGRGGQSASLYFRADNLPELLSIQGTTIQLGCATRLDVMPSVQLFSAVAGAPLKGKLSLLLLSSGGQLGTISPKSAFDAARGAARAGGRQVAGKLGVVGQQLQSAISDLLADAADKIFRRAQSRSPQNKLPLRISSGALQGPSTEHHVARINRALGGILQSAYAVKGAPAHTQQLLRHLDRDHHQRDSVVGRLEQTLSHLATATHRTLTDPIGGELRSHLARMDAILSRLRGKAGQELASGAHEISEILQRMGGIAAGKGGAPHLSAFRKLIDERRGQLHQIGAAARRNSGAGAIQHRGALQQMPSSQILGEKQLATLRKQHPGIDKLLKNASHAQLASELGRLEKSALGALLGKKRPQRNHGLGSGSIAGAFQALGGAHLGGFGGGHRPGALGRLSGLGGGLGKILEKQLGHQAKRIRSHEVGKLLATFSQAPKGTPLHDLARKAEAKQKQMATKHSGKKGPAASQITAAALLEVFKEHPRGRTFASHLAPGGSLRSLCEAAQRGHGLPVGQMAQHFLASRGHSDVFNAVATFNNLIKAGHQPHRRGLGSIGHFVSSAVGSVTRTVNAASSAADSLASASANTVRGGISSFANTATRFGGDAIGSMRNVVQRGVGAARVVASRVGSGARNLVARASDAAHGISARASGFARGAYDTVSTEARRRYDSGSRAFHSASHAITSRGHGLWNAARESGQNAWGRARQFGQSAWGQIRSGGQGLSNLARGGFAALHTGAGWVQHQAGATFDWARRNAGRTPDWARQAATGTSHWLGERVHNGLEWAKKTGVVGGIGTGLRRGVSFMKKAAEHTPLGLAVKAGKWGAGGGLAKVWDKTRNVAAAAWGGAKAAYKSTTSFLQSPAGQLLVTGLSLSASFIPGGLVVKAIVGGGIGAIQAISEGKSWKGVLAGAAGGALTGALPFLKIGPLAKVGMGALTFGITTLAQGGSLKDALKGAGGGAIDSFDPGAFKALSRLKGLTAAEKLLQGKNLSKAEKALMEGSKFAGPLRGLEKAMANPKTARMVSGLERAGSKTVKGGIWVSGKAASAQGVLEKVVGAGDKVHGALTQVYDLAPGLADALGANAAGHFVSQVGDWAGQGDEKLSKALKYGQGASDQVTKYRGYLDKGLGFAGAKNPAKAYEKMMARKDLAEGKRGGLEYVARLKLEDHKRKHPELHLAEATGRRTRGVHGEAQSPRRRSGHRPTTRLEEALGKGRGLILKGQRLAHGAFLGGLGKMRGVVEKGLAGAQKAQSDLEKAAELARAGAGILGEDSELGRHLLDLSAQADRAHAYLEQGIGFAEEFKRKTRSNDAASPLHEATYLEGGQRRAGGGHAGTPERMHAAIADTKGLGSDTAHDKPSPKKPGDPGKKKPGEAMNSVEGGLKAIGRYRKNAAKAGRKVDAKLGRLEQSLVKGMQIGSELGHFGRQISGAAGAGHDKLHEALNLAGKGKRGLHKGRELFEQGLRIAAGHHEEKLEKWYGKKQANAENERGGTQGAELVRHATGKEFVHDGKQLMYDGEHAFHDAERMWQDGKRSVHDVGHGLKDLKRGGGDVGSLLGHLEAQHHHPGPQPEPQQGGGVAGFSEAEIARVVQGAMQWVTSFGKAVSAAIRDIEKLVSGGKTKEAGDRVQEVSMTSEQTRAGVTRAVSTSAGHPALHKQAQSASKHYLEIRKHFFTFVKGLNGLAGQTTELEGVDSKKYPDLLSLSTDINSLQVKVDALGELKHSDTPMQGPVGDIKKEASELRARLGRAQSAHKGDAAALEVVAGLSGKLHQLERHLGAHADRKNSVQGDKDLGIPGAPRPQRKPGKKSHHRRHRPHGGDPIDDILNGEDGRISVDRGGVRGDVDVHDGQDVDPAAADTWIGSGEGVKLFSEVFGAFLPAEGAVVHHHRAGGGSRREPSHGGALDVGGIHGKLEVRMSSIRSRLGKLIPQRATGFFKGLFDHLQELADRISGWAKLGSEMLGEGMHYAEVGMHDLSAIEQAAAKVQGLAGRAEGFLGKMGLGQLAGFAGKIGGAAGWVDKESKLLHGGLKTADRWMGQGKKIAGQVDGAAGKAGGIFDQAEHGRFGTLLNLFKASKNGDGTDGRLVPEKMRLGSQFDEPRRLDVMTISRMEGFLGGDLAGVRIHTGPGAAQVTNRFAAEAVTVKDHIFFAPGRFNPNSTEGQRLLAHELTHVMQKGRPNLDVRTAESEALHSEHSFGYGNPQMETLNLSQPSPDFRLGDGEGLGNASGVHTAKRNRSRGHEVGGKDTMPDGDEFIEQISNRVYDLLMEELEHAFESR